MVPQTFLVTETQGLPRTAEPVAAALCLSGRAAADPRAWQLTGPTGEPQPFQFSDLQVGGSGPDPRSPAVHARLHFLADLAPHQAARYTLAPAASNASGGPRPLGPELDLTEEAGLLRVDNGHLTLLLDPEAGQLRALSHAASGFRGECSRAGDAVAAGPGRPGPRPGRAPAFPKVTFQHGPVFFQMQRAAALPGFPEIAQQLTYRLDAGARGLWVQTLLELLEDLPLQQLRGETLALPAHGFTHAVWRPAGAPGPQCRPLDPEPPAATTPPLRLPPETPWVGWAAPGYAAALLRLCHAQCQRLGCPLRLPGPTLALVHDRGALAWASWQLDPSQAPPSLLTRGTLALEECLFTVDAGPDREALFAQWDQRRAARRAPARVESCRAPERA